MKVIEIDMNLGDPELEYIDPTPNVHALFIQFDKQFFWTKLASRAVVRWSKRMYSCAGVCSYEGRGGLCDIALSEPLLKLRPRKDLVETLLHEMIHAFLFVTCRDQDRDGHGPNFKSHMYRINKAACLNISIYHDFHDEVELYQTHWWRCNGPCQTKRPHFGIVRRPMNRPPGPSDYWWKAHKQKCGGTFIKIKEPEKPDKKKSKRKSNGDITKYITNADKDIDNVRSPLTPVLKNINNNNIKSNVTKNNSGNTLVVTQKGSTCTPQAKPVAKPNIFTGTGHTLNGKRIRTKSVDAVETVRNIWANKKLYSVDNNKQILSKPNIPSGNVALTKILDTNKHKAEIVTSSPPKKVMKIDDYFHTATALIKDLYGEGINISKRTDNEKIIAVKTNLVDCPICNTKISSNEINRHLDECLNKEEIDRLCKNEGVIVPNTTALPNYSENKTKEVSLHEFETKPVVDSKVYPTNIIDLEKNNVDRIKSKDLNSTSTLDINVDKMKLIIKKAPFDKHVRNTDNFVVPKDEIITVDLGFLDDMTSERKIPPIKIEPGTSKDIVSISTEHKCPCCGMKVEKPIEQHLDECLAFFDNNTTIPEEGASTSFANETIVIDDDDDIFDETQTLNATGTKSPCPCCLQMIEQADMNKHLDICLS